MNPDNCPREVFISSQQDIATGALSRCTGPVESIIITSASDEQLNFPTEDTRRRPISNIVIRDNSDLNIVTLPTTNLSDGDTFYLEISGNPALKTMNASQLYGNAQAAFVVNLNMSDIDHGDIYFPKDSKVNDIYVYDSHAGIHNVESLSYLKTAGTILSLFDVFEIQTVEFEQYNTSFWYFSGLEQIYTAKWTNVSNGKCATPYDAPFTVLGDMIVGPSIFDGPPNPTSDNPFLTSMTFESLSSIGKNLNITENMFNTLNFSSLEDVSGQLRIEDNTNCTLFFNETTSVGSIYAANNPNTVLPGWFPKLKQANDIFLNGYINSSLDSNIFPSLETVANSIRLEPWNSDFDCAAFLDRARTNGYGSPSCNITAMDPDMTAASARPPATSPPPSSTDVPGTAPGGTTWTSTTTLQGLPSGSINTRTGSPSIKLSRVQWGIIGTGISVSFLICCFTAYYIWCLPAHKKWLWLRREERRQGNGIVPDDVANQTEPETNTERKGMPHEADGTQVVEAGGREVPHQPSELGNTAVIAEMWAPTTTLAELP